MSQWSELIHALAVHCVERYGIEEVSTWNFEVWNEPNLPFFWSGTKAEYFELYRQSATAIKSVDRRLRVGGPATAQAGWVGDLLGSAGHKASQSILLRATSTPMIRKRAYLAKMRTTPSRK